MTFALVDGFDRPGPFNTVGLVGERLLDVAVLVAMQSTIHRGRISIRRIRIPLIHNHARLAGNRTVVAWLTLLIRAHSPSGILLVRGDSNEVGVISRKGAGSSLD